MQKLEQYYYRDTFYFLNKNQIINIPSNNKILLGNSKDKDIFNKSFLTLISKNNNKRNNKEKEKIVIYKKKIVEVLAIDTLLSSLNIDKKI